MLDLGDPSVKKQVQLGASIVIVMTVLSMLAPKFDKVTKSREACLGRRGSTLAIVADYKKLCEHAENRQIDNWTRQRYLERILGGIAMAQRLGAGELLRHADMKTMIKRAKLLRSTLTAPTPSV